MFDSPPRSKSKLPQFILSACLAFGAHAANADSYTCNVEVDLIGPSYGSVLSPRPVTGENTLLLTPERLADMQAKKESGDPAYLHFISRLEAQLNTNNIYAKGDKAAFYALGYRLTQNTAYRDKAKDLFAQAYQNDPNFGTVQACGRDAFRSAGRPAVYYYNWMYDALSDEERSKIVSLFAIWAEYWVNYINVQEKIGDSDENSSLAENLTLLGLALEGTDIGDRVMATADDVFERIVIDFYLDELFKGGIWGEGSEYAAATINHWALNFLINKEVRGKNYDFNYEEHIHDSILGYIYTTLPGYTGNWKNGDMQNADSYYTGELTSRLQTSMTTFAGVTDDVYYKKLANGWMDDMEDKYPSQAHDIETSFWRVLFDDKGVGRLSPQSAGLPLTFNAEGRDFHHFRSSWSDDANALYILSPTSQTHHSNSDALHFEIARKGRWLTKEISGYFGYSWYSQAHNTLLIENYSNYSGDGEGEDFRNGIQTGYEGSNNLYISDPGKDGDIITTASAPNYNYVAADAAGPYSNSTYWSTQHAQHVTRQIANVNKDTFVVFDHVITDKHDVRDLSSFPSDVDVTSGEYIREVNYIQHFESEPTLDGAFYSTQEPESKQQLKYKTLLPVDHTQEIVDEKDYFANLNTTEDAVPLSQRKWRIKVTANERNVENRFMHVMFTGDDGQVATPSQQIVLNKESGFITKGSADITGVAMNFKGQWHIVLFNDKPPVNIANVHYRTPFVKDDEEVHHYVFGIGNGDYSIEMADGDISVARNSGEAGKDQQGTSNNSLYYRSKGGQLLNDAVAPSSPSGLKVDSRDRRDIKLSWNAASDNVVVSGYRVYRDGSESPVATVNGTSIVDAELNSSTDYVYTVSAFDLDGNESELSSELTASTRSADYVRPRAQPLPETPSGSGSDKSSAPLIQDVDPGVEITPLATAVGGITGVYPAPGSNDVDYEGTKVVIKYIVPATYKWTRNTPIQIHNLDNGALVYSIDPDELDKQNGVSNYTIELDSTVLKPGTRYGVTAKTKFAIVQRQPYHVGTIAEGAWTFSTKAAVPVAPPVDIATVETVTLSESVALLEGVYPAAGSSDVDYKQAKLALDFATAASFKWTRYASLEIRNLDNGALVYSVDPDELDPQQGSSRYTIELEEGVLKPNTHYGVTSKSRFALMQTAPYSMGAVTDGLWTFTTIAGEAVDVEEAVPLAKPVALLEGVFPPSGSTDIDHDNAKLVLNFEVPANYKWTANSALSIHDLATGELVYSVDPGESDAQNGLASYTILLDKGVLKAKTKYGVTSAERFARMSRAPYNFGAITEGMWTFMTK